MSMKLSVIIPVYNVEQYLERCILSIENQDIERDSFEVLLINDGSTDNSYEIACRLKDKYSNITVFTQENKGQAAARNIGLKKAIGNFVLFVDSDDYLLPNVFSRILQIAEKNNPDILVMQSRSMRADGSFHQSSPPFGVDKFFSGEQLLLKGYRPASVWAKLFRRNLIVDNNIVFIEGIIHEDVDFDMKLFTYAQRIMFLDLCCYVYYWNSMSTDKLMNHDKIMKSMKSDIEISKDFKMFSTESHLGSGMPHFFIRHANSIITSLCYSLLTRYKYLPFSNKKEIIKIMKEKDMLPIKGKTNSKKSDIFKVLLIFPYLLLVVLRLHSFFINSDVN